MSRTPFWIREKRGIRIFAEHHILKIVSYFTLDRGKILIILKLKKRFFKTLFAFADICLLASFLLFPRLDLTINIEIQ